MLCVLLMLEEGRRRCLRLGTRRSQHGRCARRVRLSIARYKLDLILTVEEWQGSSRDTLLNLLVELIIFVEVVAELVLFGCVGLGDSELLHDQSLGSGFDGCLGDHES